MTDQSVDLPTPESLATEVSIPAALAAPRTKRGRKPADVGPVQTIAAPAPIEAAPVASVPAEPAIDAVADPIEPLNPTAAAPAEPVIEEPIMATTIENMTAATTDKVQAQFADMNGRAKDAMEKSTKFLGEMNGFAKANVEAMVESGKLAVAGMQSMAQDQAAFIRKQFEDMTATARTMATVKSPTEFAKLQGDFARQQFDGAVAEMSRSTEAMLKLAGEVVQPISNRVAVAVEKIKLAA